MVFNRGRGVRAAYRPFKPGGGGSNPSGPNCGFAAIEQESGESREESRRDVARSPAVYFLLSPLWFGLPGPSERPVAQGQSARLITGRRRFNSFRAD